jgi:hypothetical protein
MNVSMKAAFLIKNCNEKCHRIITARIDAKKILNADTLQTAINYFISEIEFINEAFDFEFFEIEGKKFDADFWRYR